MKRAGDATGAPVRARFDSTYLQENLPSPSMEHEVPPLPKLKSGAASAIVQQLGYAPLRNTIRRLSAARVAEAVRATEYRQGTSISAEWQAKLLSAKPGETVRSPINIIRPGQSEISFINVRQKMLDFVGRIEEKRESAIDAPQDLLGYEEALTAVVGPGGRYLVLTDGHHHIAALKAVEGVVDNVIGDSLARTPTANAKKPASEIQAVQNLFGGSGGVPKVPIVITDNLSNLSEREFWQTMEARNLTWRGSNPSPTARVPQYFGALADNPFRYLAGIITGKLRTSLTKDEWSASLGGSDYPVWIKMMEHSTPFIEFRIGEILREAFEKLGLTYDPEKPLTKELRQICRAALLFARADPRHPCAAVVDDIPVLIKEVERAKLEAAIDLNVRGLVGIPRRFTRPRGRRLTLYESRMTALAKSKKKPAWHFSGGIDGAKAQLAKTGKYWVAS